MLKAIIFDFDGVLADTEPLHFTMFERVLQEEKIPLTEREYYEKYMGFDDKECFQAVLAAHGRDTAPDAIVRLVERKAAIMLRHITTAQVVYPDAPDFVKEAASRYRLAIVSGALRHEIELILKNAGMRNHFEHITAAEDVRRGKPAPEGYLHALQALNRRGALEARECLVIEDTVFGIQAAHAAGMRCVALATTAPAGRLAEADAVAASLKACDLASLASGFEG